MKPLINILRGVDVISVYGNNKNIPFKETHSVSYAISPYAFTKKSNEVQIHTYHHLYNINQGVEDLILFLD